jgi:hypothetical protein
MLNACGSSVMLDAAAQLALARWAVKTAAVISRIDYSGPFPFAHRHHLANRAYSCGWLGMDRQQACCRLADHESSRPAHCYKAF